MAKGRAKGPSKNNFGFWRERRRARCEARGGSIAAGLCDRRATKQMARRRSAPQGWGCLARWRCCSLGRVSRDTLPRSRVASEPNNPSKIRSYFCSDPKAKWRLGWSNSKDASTRAIRVIRDIRGGNPDGLRTNGGQHLERGDQLSYPIAGTPFTDAFSKSLLPVPDRPRPPKPELPKVRTDTFTGRDKSPPDTRLSACAPCGQQWRKLP